MTHLINRFSPFFDKEKARELYAQNAHFLNNTYDFEYAADNDYFFNIHDKGEFVGCCYVMFETHEGKEVPFYNGFSKRKKHKEMLEAQNILLGILFDQYDVVYTYTPHKHAQFFNKRAGMKEHAKPGVFYKEKKEWEAAAEKAEAHQKTNYQP